MSQISISVSVTDQRISLLFGGFRITNRGVPQNSKQGRICMLSNLQRLSAENKMKKKVQVGEIREKIKELQKHKVNTFFWIVLLEFPMLYLTFILTQREIPRIAEIPRCTKFYVLKPQLEPRRCSYPNPILVNDMRDEGQLKNMTILDNGVQLVLPPIDHISQGRTTKKGRI